MLVTGFPRPALGPLAVAALVRVTAWALVPSHRFASDEQGYLDAGFALAATGQQDLFWPPLTGWVVAGVAALAPSVPLAVLRLLWIALDLVNVALVAMLADRVAAAALPERRARVTALATLAYALYLPAISHAQFVTSEVPALLLVLVALVVATSPWPRSGIAAATGAVLGALVLARANLAPLLLLIPGAAWWHLPRRDWLRLGAVAVVAGSLLVGAALARNWVSYGEPTLSRNAAYNLYIGNRDFYAEDLDLFSPRATPEQIEFRRQFFAGTLTYPTGTAAELQREALAWIADHPLTFLRRALGRLARVFAPKTDVLELAGGEAAVGVFSPAGLALLGAANLQWTVALFGGLLGLRLLWDRHRPLGLTFVATILGSVVLCLVAIAKPRYTFPFDPLLLIGAVLALVAAGPERAAAWRRSRLVLAPIYAFLVWGWVAWVIFALSSRLAL